MINVLLVLVLAHLLGDFVTQTRGINHAKRHFTRPFYSKGLLNHVTHHMVFSLVLLLVFAEWKYTYIMIIVLIAFFHYLIDFAKVKIENYVIPRLSQRRQEETYWLRFIFGKKTTYFLLDQGMHLFSIYAALILFQMAPPLKGFFTDVQALGGGDLFVVCAILLVLLTFASAHFIAVLMGDLWQPDAKNELAAAVADDDEEMKQIKNKVMQSHVDFIVHETFLRDEEQYRLELQHQTYARSPEGTRGKYIGMMERMLIALFIVFHVHSGFVLLIAMKTLARFKQFDNKDFAEYYLVGTLLSLIIGIVFALMLAGIAEF